MSKSLKFKNYYIDSTSITHNRELLSNILGKITYEEGRWTPNLENATVSYTRRNGRYIKIGKIVFVWWSLRGNISVIGGTEWAQISGLPYTCAFETAGTLYEHINCCTDNNVNILIRIVNNLICLQQDNVAAGGYLYKWASSDKTFYMSGMAVYLNSETY